MLATLGIAAGICTFGSGMPGGTGCTPCGSGMTGCVVTGVVVGGGVVVDGGIVGSVPVGRGGNSTGAGGIATTGGGTGAG